MSSLLDLSKVGTHNTMTYLAPAKWYMWLFRFAFRCLSLTIEELLEAGIRLFDLRIRKNSDDKWVFAHGLVNFKGPNVIDVISKINEYPNCTVRIMWETENEDDPKEGKEFMQLCNTLKNQFTNIKFFGGTSIATWVNWYNFHPYGENDDRWEFLLEQFVSSLSSIRICAVWPWLYTALLRKKLRKKAEESTADFVTLDFIKKSECIEK